MATWELVVEGTTVTPLVDVEPESSDEGTLSRAKATVGNTSGSRSIGSGASATIKKNGSTEMVGTVTKKPTKGDAGDFLEVFVADNRYELTLQEVHRPFVNTDSGEIITEAVNQEAETRNSVLIHTGEGPGSDWSHNLPVFELANYTEKRYREYGSNLIFAGWREGNSGEFRATYTAVPSAAIPGSGQVSRLKTRLLANNTGDQIRGEVELRDNNGVCMIWPLPQLSGNFNEYELQAEDAVQTASIGSAASSNGVLEYRFELTGDLSEPRAVLIDHAETLPFATSTRSTNITPSRVESTERSITRRFDASVMEVIQDLAEEDDFTSYVDNSDVLYYEPSGDQPAPSSIDYNGGTPVVEASNEKDYDRIINKLTVVGDDLQVTVTNESSIRFYGVSEREDQLVDNEIQTRSEARDRGRGVLRDAAWHDSALTFQIADTTFADVQVGQSMTITWDPFDITSMDFIVSKKNVKPSGIVELSFTGFTG